MTLEIKLSKMAIAEFHNCHLLHNRCDTTKKATTLYCVQCAALAALNEAVNFLSIVQVVQVVKHG